MTNQPQPVSLSLRLATLVRGLRRIVVGRGHQLGLPRPLLDAVSLRLTRMAARFDYLLTRALQTPPQSAP